MKADIAHTLSLYSRNIARYKLERYGYDMRLISYNSAIITDKYCDIKLLWNDTYMIELNCNKFIYGSRDKLYSSGLVHFGGYTINRFGNCYGFSKRIRGGDFMIDVECILYNEYYVIDISFLIKYNNRWKYIHGFSRFYPYTDVVMRLYDRILSAFSSELCAYNICISR